MIAVSMGDPAGIGPEVVLKALASRPLKKAGSLFLVIGDSACLSKIAKRIRLGLPDNLLDMANIKKFHYGKLQPSCGRAALQYIDRAVELLEEGRVKAFVTAPVNKEAINMAGVKFSGHTEYLAEKSGVRSVAMMFVGRQLRVALVTRHLPLREVSSSISTENIEETVILADKYLKDFFGIKNPRIGVLGLNPHAGEEGLLGSEEKEIIAPAINRLKKKVRFIKGPLPADSAFYYLYNGEYDILVAMYHDQGMIPIKMLARNRAVNVTLGLPYIRTSPVHGTAFDIAGKGIADPSSMIEALKLAAILIDKKLS